MQKTYDEWHYHQQPNNGQRTEFNLQIYEQEGEKPVFVVSPSEGKGDLNAQARNDIAKGLAENRNLPPDEVKMVERQQDGALKEHEFTSFTREYRTFGNDIGDQEYREAEKAGQLKTTEATFFQSREKDISKEDAQKLVGQENSLDKPTSYEQRQEEAFSAMEGPAIDRESAQYELAVQRRQERAEGANSETHQKQDQTMQHQEEQAQKPHY